MAITIYVITYKAVIFLHISCVRWWTSPLEQSCEKEENRKGTQSLRRKYDKV
jgi:hypothetical protein